MPEKEKNRSGLKDILFKNVWIIFLLLSLAGYAAVYSFNFNSPPIRSDGEGYYAYLPSYFIQNDFYMEKLAAERYGGSFPIWTGIQKFAGTGHWVDKYPIGESFLLSPFFFVADVLTRIFHYARDGYSFFYQYAAGLAGVFYAVAGLYVLRKLLSKYYSKKATITALIAIFLGTNLFHYATYDTIFSHAFSFFLFASFLFQIIRWYEKPKLGRSILLGFIMGLIFLVKIPNSIVWVFWLLFGITSLEAVKDRLSFFKTHLKSVATLFAALFLTILPQLLIWKELTGKLLINPYLSETFTNWASPQILNVLFSPTKGLFFWSPILVFSVIGFFFLRKKMRFFITPIILFFCLQLYLVASWWDWGFGGSFGHRAFTETLPIFALGMASFADELKTGWRRSAAYAIGFILIALNLFLMFQYWRRMIPFTGTDLKTFFAAFGL